MRALKLGRSSGFTDQQLCIMLYLCVRGRDWMCRSSSSLPPLLSPFLPPSISLLPPSLLLSSFPPSSFPPSLPPPPLSLLPSSSLLPPSLPLTAFLSTLLVGEESPPVSAARPACGVVCQQRACLLLKILPIATCQTSIYEGGGVVSVRVVRVVRV